MARPSLSLREHATYEDTLPLLHRSLTAHASPARLRRALLSDRTSWFAHNNRRGVGPWAIAECFGDMGRRNLSQLLEVADCPCHFQNAVVPPRGQSQTFGRGLEQESGFWVNRRVCVKPTTDCVRVAGYSVLLSESLSLRRAGALYSRAD